MSVVRIVSIPLLLLLGVLGPIYWAFPTGLPVARTSGIVFGWAGCGLLLSSLLLMLREARLANWLGGLERMYRWHHWAGMAAYVLLLAHPLLLAANALPNDRELAWQTLSPFSQGRPVWLGWLSLLTLMIGLATTFDRRISYGRWRWLHISLGIGVVLGLLHLLLLGIDEPVLPLLGLAILFLGWRILREDRGWAAHPYIVQHVNPVAQNMVEVSLRPLGDGLAVRPGQFILVAFLDGPAFRGCGEFHPFTVSGSAVKDEIRLGIKALGDCTRHLQSIEPGTMARVDGAFGGFLSEQDAVPQLWVAGGIGITPFLAFLRAGNLRQPTTLVYLYRSEADAAFVTELEQLATANPKLSLRAQATGDRLPDLNTLLPDRASLAGHDCYLCGPPAMVSGLRTALTRLGVKPSHIHLENFEFR